MQAVRYSETSANLCQTIRRQLPERDAVMQTGIDVVHLISVREAN